jgi:hypothetical protein
MGLKDNVLYYYLNHHFVNTGKLYNDNNNVIVLEVFAEKLKYMIDDLYEDHYDKVFRIQLKYCTTTYNGISITHKIFKHKLKKMAICNPSNDLVTKTVHISSLHTRLFVYIIIRKKKDTNHRLLEI